MKLLKNIMLAILLLVSQIVSADETEQANQVVTKFQAELLKVMQQGEQLNFKQRFAELKPSVMETHDLVKITRIVVSREWKKLSTEQKKLLISKFSTLSIASYAHYFKSYSGESFKTDSIKQLSPGQIYVHSYLVLPEDKDVSMDFLLKKRGDKWRIINIITNGVSDLALKRSEYVAVLKKSGFDELIKQISSKIKKFSS